MSNTAVRLMLKVALGCVLCSVVVATAYANDADDQFAMAASHYSAKQWDAAVMEFRKFLHDYPDHAKHAKAMFFEAEALVQSGRAAEAYPLFVDVLAEEPTGTTARLSLFGAAEAAVLSGKTDEAQVRLSQFQSQYAGDKLNAKVLIYQGDLAQKSGDTALAEKYYRQSLEKFADLPTADQCRMNLVRLLEKQSQFDAADALLHDVAQREHSPWSEMALLQLASKELGASRPQAALEQYEAIAKRYPNSPLLPEINLGCGKALVQLGHYAEAEGVLKPLADSSEVGLEAKHWVSMAEQAQTQAKISAEMRRIEQESAAAKAAQPKASSDADNVASSPKPKADSGPDNATKDSAKDNKPPVVAAKPSPSKSLIKSILSSSRRDPKAVPPVPSQPTLTDKPSADQPSADSVAASDAKPSKSAAASSGTPTTNTLATTTDTTPDVAKAPLSNIAAADSAAAASVLSPKSPELEPVPSDVAAARDEQTHRQSAMVRYKAADGMIRAGQYDRAIATLQMGDNSGDDPRSLGNRYLLATALEATKRSDEALVTLDDLSEKLQARLAANASATGQELTADDLASYHALNDSVQLARATALLTREKYAEAIPALKAYLATPRKDVGAEHARSALAISLTHIDGHLAEAQQVLEELKANHPDSKLILPTAEAVVDATYAAGEYQNAAVLFKDLAADGNPPELVSKGLSGMAWCYVQLNEDDAAEAAFAKFLERFPDGPRAADAALLRAQILERKGKNNEALAVYRDAIKRYGKSEQMPKFLYAAAQLYTHVKQDEDAAPLYQRIVHDYPTFPEIDTVLYSWAWSLRDMGRSSDADKVFHIIYDNHPDSRFWPDSAFRIAERASQQGQNDAAADILKQITDGNTPTPVLQHALFLQAQIAIAKENWSAAEAPLTRLVRDFPEGSMRLAAEFWLAEMAYRSGDYVTAQQRFEILAPRATNRTEKWTGLVPLRRAQIYATQKQWGQALALAESISHDFPQFSQQFEADYLIGRCLAEQADFEGARAAFDKVVHSPAGGKTELAAIAQWMIGETYFHQGNYSAALREYLRTEVVYPYARWQAAALVQSAKCYEKLGQPQQASAMYTRVLQNYPQTEFVAEASKRLVETSRR